MPRSERCPIEALTIDFAKEIEIGLSRKTGWGRNEIMEVVTLAQNKVLARHLNRAIETLHPRYFERREDPAVAQLKGDDDLPWEP